MQRIEKGTFRLDVDDNDLHMESGVKRLVNFGERLVGIGKLAFIDHAHVRRDFSGAQDGCGFSRSGYAGEKIAVSRTRSESLRTARRNCSEASTAAALCTATL